MAKKDKKPKTYDEVIQVELDRIAYENHLLSNMGEHIPRISSGCLVNDLIMGGGIPPAMTTFSGHEGGGKSTLMTHSFNEAMKAHVKNIVHFDAENARDPEYVTNIFRGYELEQVYGVQSKGTWEIPPKISYYPYSQFERIFSMFRGILNVLPDKVYRNEDNTWYYVFRNKKDELARMKSMELKPEKKISDRKRIWCPTDDEGIQIILAVDSWVALVLESEEEEENDKQGIAAEARAFSKRLRQIKGRLTRKQAVLLGCNQLRTNPMAGRYGNPDYEPGGQSLKFYSDIRNGLRPIVPPKGLFVRDKTAYALAVEPAVYGEKGSDRYAFKSITNLKNKYGRPLLKGQMRIWVSDRNGIAQGIDPVYDVYQYLSMTGQIDGSIKRGFTINVKALKGVKMKWHDFKELVLFQHFDDKKNEKAWFKEHKAKKRINLRQYCEEQLATGEAIDLFNAAQASSSKHIEESDLEESSD